MTRDESSKESTDTQQESDILDDDDKTYEKSFGRIVKFLWSVIHVSKSVNNTNMIPCSKPSMMAWLGKIHQDHLYQVSASPATNCRPTSSLNNHHKQELLNKREKDPAVALLSAMNLLQPRNLLHDNTRKTIQTERKQSVHTLQRFFERSFDLDVLLSATVYPFLRDVKVYCATAQKVYLTR